MKKLLSLVISAIAVTVSGVALADTIELANGDMFEGDFIGSSNGIEAFPESEVVGVFFSSGVETALEFAEAPGPAALTVPL